MKRTGIVVLCVLAAVGFLLTMTPLGHGPWSAKKPLNATPAEAANPGVPVWPYPKGVHATQTIPDGQVFHIAGSTRSYTYAEINKGWGTVDWFPRQHPPAPGPVIDGRKGTYHACGQCHLIDGRGKPDTADLQGLPVTYFLQQLADMKDGARRGNVPWDTVNDMIKVAKALDADDAMAAAKYFHAMPAKQSARVVETDLVPVTHAGPHNVQLVDASGAKEPLGVRIIEVPMDLERTELRDATSGFIAYVPSGSIERGAALAKTGVGGKAHACVTCHGVGLKGKGDKYPPLAGRSATAIAREMWDFKCGARNGKNAADMRAVTAQLSDEDIVDAAAYAASLRP